MTYDWSRFTKRIPVKADPLLIYESWATPAGLETIFLRKAEFKTANGELRPRGSFLQAGDTYEWMWHGYDDDTNEHGEVLEVNPPGETSVKNMLRFTFGKAGTVSISVLQEEGQTIIELTQENIPTDEEGKVYYHLGCSGGWTFHLANMKSILEGGPDLRNKNVNIKSVVNS
jgi:hypothetical protein